MALSLQADPLVWQKVEIAMMDANPATVAAFKALKAYSNQKKHPTLQFVPFTEVQCDVAGGTAVVDAAHHLYAVYLKKENSATDNLFLVYDDATDDTTDAHAVAAMSVLEANAESYMIYPNGLPMATGAVVTQYTSASGIGKADGSTGGSGFLIIGAA